MTGSVSGICGRRMVAERRENPHQPPNRWFDGQTLNKFSQDGRIEWVDVAKGIGIIAVILGHLSHETINQIVFPWHMPLFFILSGWFMSGKDCLGAFIDKRAKGLLLPFVYTSIVLVLASIFWGCYATGFPVGLKNGVRTLLSSIGGSGCLPVFGCISPIGAIWFLEALFVSQIVVRMVCRLHKMWGWIVILLLFLSAWSSAQYVWLPFNFQAGMFAALFVWYGVCIGRKLAVDSPVSIFMAVMGFVCLSTSILIGAPPLDLARNFINIWQLAMIPFVVQFVLVAAFQLSKIGFIRRVLSWYGRHSLSVLCCHLVELNEIPWSNIFGKFGVDLWDGSGNLLLLIVAKFIFVTTGVILIRHLDTVPESVKVGA